MATESSAKILPLIEDQKTMTEATTPMRRLVTPEDVAGFASFLLSSRASMVTGQVHVIDGGQSVSFGLTTDFLRAEQMRAVVDS